MYAGADGRRGMRSLGGDECRAVSSSFRRSMIDPFRPWPRSGQPKGNQGQLVLPFLVLFESAFRACALVFCRANRCVSSVSVAFVAETLFLAWSFLLLPCSVLRGFENGAKKEGRASVGCAAVYGRVLRSGTGHGVRLRFHGVNCVLFLVGRFLRPTEFEGFGDGAGFWNGEDPSLNKGVEQQQISTA